MLNKELHGHGDPLLAVVMKGKDFGVEDKENQEMPHETKLHGDPLFQEVQHHGDPKEPKPLHSELSGHGDPLLDEATKMWKATEDPDKKLHEFAETDTKKQGDPLFEEFKHHKIEKAPDKPTDTKGELPQWKRFVLGAIGVDPDNE